MTAVRSRRNALASAMTRTFVPRPEQVWQPIRPRPRPEEPEAPQIGAGPLYETDTILVTNLIGVRESQQVTLNRRATVIDGWLHDDETYFERRHIRVIERSRDLWREVSMAANDPTRGAFDNRGLEMARDDEDAARALNLLRRARALVPRWQWNLFENVVRWNEPYGFPGSRLWSDRPERGEWARLVVRSTAETIAKSLFL